MRIAHSDGLTAMATESGVVYVHSVLSRPTPFMHTCAARAAIMFVMYLRQRRKYLVWTHDATGV